MESIALEEDLICAICRDIFVEPVTLPCGHNYCKACIDLLKKSTALTAENGRGRCYSCPLCLSLCETCIPLKRNVLLQSIVEKWQQKSSGGGGVDCTICKGQQRLPAEKSCIQCGHSYCTVHIMPHLENRAFREHVLVGPLSDMSRLCRDHGKELELYCETDSTPLCVYCMLPTDSKHHAQHSVRKLSEAVGSVKECCKVKLDSVRVSLAGIRDNLQKLEETASISKDSLTNQQQSYSGFINKIKMFLEVEEKAWQKRFSVDIVTESRKIKCKVEKMKQLQERLQKAESTLQQVQDIQDPFTLLQLMENVSRCDVALKEVCPARIQKGVLEVMGVRPAALARDVPLFHILLRAFTGEHIRFDPSTAHTLLGMDTDRTSLWISEETDGDNITADSNGDTYCVLGGVAFSQGVHYWEVDVRVVASWALGVAYGGTHSLELDSASCWSLSYRQDKQQYCAHHQSLAFSFSARSAPSSIGLFLDLDSGILCFYDAGLSQTLHTFYCRFSLPLFPLFCLGQVTCNQSATQMMKVLDPVANQLPRT